MHPLLAGIDAGLVVACAAGAVAQDPANGHTIPVPSPGHAAIPSICPDPSDDTLRDLIGAAPPVSMPKALVVGGSRGESSVANLELP